MAKDNRWNKFFRRGTRAKVPVVVDGKPEAMTNTQAYRFDELTNTGEREPPAAGNNPLDDSQYTLEDAAFRLMTSPEELLQRAATGSPRLYVDASGMTGHWRRVDPGGETAESSPRTLKTGYLALPVHSCNELNRNGEASVLTLELPELADLGCLGIEASVLKELTAWGAGQKLFCAGKPVLVKADQVVLLAPLAE